MLKAKGAAGLSRLSSLLVLGLEDGQISKSSLAFRAVLVVSYLTLEGVAFRGCEGNAGELRFQQ